MIIRIFVGLCTVFLLTSCGVMQDTRNRQQSVLLQTPYVKEARCELMDAHTNRWIVKETPKLFAIQSGHPPLTIFCRKTGYKDTVAKVEDYVMAIDDLKKIPLIAEEFIGVGLDPYATFWSRYPDHIKVWMEPEEWPSDEFQKKWAYERQVYNNEQTHIKKEREEKQKEDEGVTAASGSERENTKAHTKTRRSHWQGTKRDESKETQNSYESFYDFFIDAFGPKGKK